MEPGELVVALVLETGQPREAAVDGRRGVTPFRQDPDRLVGGLRVVGGDVEDVGRVERVALGVKRVAGVLDEHDLVLGEEGAVVEAAVYDVTQIDEGEGAGAGRRALLGQLEHGAEAAECRAGLGARVGVAGLVEEELLELRARMKLAVLRPLERCAQLGLGGGVGVERVPSTSVSWIVTQAVANELP
jgi:hypothetical protein